MKKWIRDYFGFSQKESNGFIVIGLIIILLLTFNWVYARLGHKPPSSQEYAQFDKEIKNIEQNLAEVQISKKELEYFPFNPNNLNLEEWQSLGVPEYLGKRILNYLNKGGKFRKKSDLAKIYGFPEDLYQSLSTYIQLPDKVAYQKKYKNKPYKRYDKSYKKKDRYKKNERFEEEQYKKEKKSYKKQEIEVFELNTATEEELKQIKGIGDKRATTIIKYRNYLGGFASKEQLYEVYGLQEETEIIENLKQATTLNTNSLQKIKLNKVNVEMLSKHPYINKKLANIIIKYRSQHGDFESINDVKKIKVINEKTLQKVAPYLSFEK